jgi:hypothetical protein
MHEHCDEENRVEVWDGRSCPNDETPCKRLDPISSIVRFTGEGPPAGGEKSVSARRKETVPQVDRKLATQQMY